MSPRMADSIEVSSRKSAISTVNRSVIENSSFDAAGRERLRPIVLDRCCQVEPRQHGGGIGDGEDASAPGAARKSQGQGQLRIGGNSASAERTDAIRSTSSSATDQGSSFQRAGKNQSRRVVTARLPACQAQPDSTPGRHAGNDRLVGGQSGKARTTSRPRAEPELQERAEDQVQNDDRRSSQPLRPRPPPAGTSG